jgi:hypothetical protein
MNLTREKKIHFGRVRRPAAETFSKYGTVPQNTAGLAATASHKHPTAHSTF